MPKHPDEEPRPTCPECGRVVNPHTCVPYAVPKRTEHRLVAGIYCCEAHLMLAMERGYPKDRARRA